jgi:hypothetical protein
MRQARGPASETLRFTLGPVLVCCRVEGAGTLGLRAALPFETGA